MMVSFCFMASQGSKMKHVHAVLLYVHFTSRSPWLRTREDPYPYAHRWRTIGMVGTVVVLVVPTWPDSDMETGEETGRIISARKATRHERGAYEEGQT